MVQVTSRERVDRFWSQTLGVDAVEFHTAGVHVFPNPPQRATWPGIYVLSFDQGNTVEGVDQGTSACVFTPPELIQTVSAMIARVGTDAVCDPEIWNAASGVHVGSVLGPVVHHYLDDIKGLGDRATGRVLDGGDTASVDQLRDSVPTTEWTAAGFGEDPAVRFGIFDGDRLMALANLTSGPETATDIGLVVRPEARGQGYGVQAVATAASYAVATHAIARFRVLAASASTLGIARTLGFEAYGRNLTVYLT